METESSLLLIAIVCIFGHVLTIWLQMGMKVQIHSSVEGVDEGIHERIDHLDENLGQIVGHLLAKVDQFGSPQEQNPLLSILQHFVNNNSPRDDYSRDADGQFNGTQTLDTPHEIIEAQNDLD
jgi:hypothetical protein